MKPLDPVLVATLPETAGLEILEATMETTVVALFAAYPRLARDEHPPGSCSDEPSACCVAATIVDLIHQLDEVIIHYRDLVEAELDADRHFMPPF